MPNLKKCWDTMEKATGTLRAIRSSSMISGTSTMTRNVIGNTGMVVSKPGRSLLAVPIDAAISVVTGQRTRYASEVPAELFGMFKALPAALRKTGRRARAVREIDDIYSGRVQQIAGGVMKIPFKAMSVVDQFFYDKVFHGEMWRQAERAAKQLGKSAADVMDEQAGIATKLDKIEGAAEDLRKMGEALKREGKTLSREQAAEMRRLTAEAEELHSKSFIKKAAFMADRTVYTAREGEALDKSLDALDLMAKYNPLVDLLLPFRRTPANVVRELLRSSPIGLVTGANRAAQQLAKGVPIDEIQGRLVDDMSQAILGTATMYTFIHYAAAGQIKANPFKEAAPAERATEEAAGILPNTIQIGDWSVPVDRLEPFGPFLLNAARVAELRKGENPPENLVEDLVAATTNLALLSSKETFLDPLAEFTEAIQDDKSLAKYMQGVGATFVPRVVGQFDQRVKEDPGGGPIAGFINKLPGQGEAKLGLFGAERVSQAPTMSHFLGRTGKLGNDPVAQEMVRVGSFHLPPTSFDSIEDPAEQRLARQAKGRFQRQAVERVIKSPQYQQLPPTPQGNKLRKDLIDKAYELAGSAVNQRVKALKTRKVPLTERNILGQ